MSGVRRILATSFSRLLLGGVVIAAIGTALFATGLIKKKSNPNEIVRKGLVVNAEQLDLGDIYYTDSIEHTFTVSNPTSKPIEIEKWSTSCNCSVVEPQQLMVPANRTHYLFHWCDACCITT